VVIGPTLRLPNYFIQKILQGILIHLFWGGGFEGPVLMFLLTVGDGLDEGHLCKGAI
jgi:hypothetical protein